MEVKKDWRLWNETKPPFEIDIRERKHTACFDLKRTLELSFFAPTLPSLLVYQTDNTT